MSAPEHILAATGTFLTDPPTLRVSAGRGNGLGHRREVHLALRDTAGDRTHLIQGWFDADELLDAVTNALAADRSHLIMEPAA